MEHSILRMLGQRIRDIRKQKGMSQEVLGERAGFHFSFIGGVERAEKNITLLNLEKIARGLEVPVNELFTYGKLLKSSVNEKDQILNEINERLVTLKETELKKVCAIVNELYP